MAISVHPYVSGVPHRIPYLEQLYRHVLGKARRAALDRRADCRLVSHPSPAAKNVMAGQAAAVTLLSARGASDAGKLSSMVTPFGSLMNTWCNPSTGTVRSK